jgi:tetratricopeptide (TPR) repeat protein
MTRLGRTPRHWSRDHADHMCTFVRLLQAFPIIAAICVIFNALGWGVCILAALVLGGGMWLAVKRESPRRLPPAAGEMIARKRARDAHFALPSANPLRLLGDQVSTLAREAPVRAPVPLLQESREIQAELKERLDAAHSLKQHATLCRMAGTVSCVVADAQLSLGNVDEAVTEIGSAWRLAEVGNDDSLRVWCAAARSWVAYMRDQPQVAAAAARAGHQYAHTASARQRLFSMEGSALALAGDRAAALEAFSLAAEARAMPVEFDPVFDGIGGIFAASHAKQLQNEANGLTMLGLPGRAAGAAGRAIELFAVQAPDSWDYSLEAGAWTTLGIARLMVDRADDAWEALQPVLALPPSRRTSYVVMKLRDMLKVLERQQGVGGADARAFRSAIDPFVASAVAM